MADAEFRNRGNADFPTAEQREERSRRTHDKQVELTALKEWFADVKAGRCDPDREKIGRMFDLQADLGEPIG